MQELTIIKIGGKLIDNEQLSQECLQAFASKDGHKILVHGGGKSGSAALEQMGIEVKYHQGRRITDQETLKVITMVYAGDINKSLTAKLQSLQCNAIGLSGCDMNIIQAHKRIVKEIDYGYAGDIDHINAEGIAELLSIGLTPVISPITHDRKGQLLNTNADTIAATIAGAMTAYYDVRLYYCFEYMGVMQDLNDHDSLIPYIKKSEQETYLADGTISSGMIPKLTNAYYALGRGATEVSIGDHTHFTKTEGFTRILLS